MSKPKIFISYSHEDEKWKDFIKKFFKATNDTFDIWDDRNIKLGEDWFVKIDDNIKSTKIAILLISVDFLNSNFIKSEEIPKFLDKCKKNDLKLVPIIISSCSWDRYSWLSAKQGYPRDNKPLDTFQQNYNYRFEDCPSIRKEITNLVNRIIKEYEEEQELKKESSNYSTAKENQIEKLTNFLIETATTKKQLQDIAKIFIKEQIYQKVLDTKTTLKDIVDYLDGLIIEDIQPIACIINQIYHDKNIENQEIKEWLASSYKKANCDYLKSLHTESKVDLNDEYQQNRTVIYFEQKNNKKVDVYIRYFINGAFKSAKESLFENKNILDEEFEKEFVQKIYDKEFISGEHLNIILPKNLLLTNIKQWKFSPRKRLTKMFKVNIHLKERVDLAEDKRESLKNIWKNKYKLQQEIKLNKSLKVMSSEEDEATKDTTEAGLIYLYNPSVEIFSDDMVFSLISLRCGDIKKIDNYNNWWNNNNNKIKLHTLKQEIDKDENSYITLIWDDPNIPLKPKGEKTDGR